MNEHVKIGEAFNAFKENSIPQLNDNKINKPLLSRSDYGRIVDKLDSTIEVLCLCEHLLKSDPNNSLPVVRDALVKRVGDLNTLRDWVNGLAETHKYSRIYPSPKIFYGPATSKACEQHTWISMEGTQNIYRCPNCGCMKEDLELCTK